MWSICCLQRSAKKAEVAGGETEIVIARLAHQGDGLAEIEGRAVHIPLTAPGDRVRIAYGGTHGHVIERLADGPDRVAPPCPHFGACGGCALQHIAPEAYRRFKLESVRETLAQRGLSDALMDDLVVIPEGTRRRATLAFRIRDGAAALGFYRAGSRALADLDHCLVLRPEIMAAFPALKKALVAHLPDGAGGRLHVTLTETGLDLDLAPTEPLPSALSVRLATLAVALDLARLTFDGETLAERRKPQLRFDGIALVPPPRAFLQPSVEGEAQLIAWVRDGVGNAKRVADLFSGLGTFTLPLARTAKVHAVDSEPALLSALGHAARQAQGLKPVTTEARDLMRNPVPVKQLAPFDAVVFDPPRAGAKAQTEVLAKSGVSRIVAVSCNAATFARDAKLLCTAGYALRWIRPLDQFLWSAHIELVALFTREAR